MNKRWYILNIWSRVKSNVCSIPEESYSNESENHAFSHNTSIHNIKLRYPESDTLWEMKKTCKQVKNSDFILHKLAKERYWQ